MKPISLLRPQLAALYQHIGNSDEVLKILELFYDVMSKDTMIGFFFTGKDLKKIALKQSEFLLRAMGASPSYEGKPPAQAHTELPPILSGHFDRRLVLLRQVLEKHELPEAHIKTWVDFENAFRAAIVTAG